MQVRRRRAGSQQPAGRAGQPPALPPAEVDAAFGPPLPGRGGRDRVGQRGVEHGGGEHVQRAPDRADQAEVAAELGHAGRRRHARLGQHRRDGGQGRGQRLLAQQGDLLQRLAGLLGGAQQRAEPRVVVRRGAERAEAGGLAQLLAQRVQLGAVQRLQRGAAHPDPRARSGTAVGQPGERLLGVVGADVPGLASGVQGLHVPGQPAPAFEQRRGDGLEVRARHPAGPFEGQRDLAGHPAAVGGAVVQVEHQVVEPDRGQPGQHGVDRRPLLGDEQRALAGRGEAGDQVGDGLRLAGARRPLDDQVRAGQDGVHDGLLGRVGVQHEVLGAGVGVGGAGRAGRAGGDGGQRVGVPGERRDHVVRGEGVALGLQVGDHRQPGVGERAHHEPVLHREAGDVAAGLRRPARAPAPGRSPRRSWPGRRSRRRPARCRTRTPGSAPAPG